MYKILRKLFFYFGRHFDVYEQDLCKSIWVTTKDEKITSVDIVCRAGGVEFDFEDESMELVATMVLPLSAAGVLFEELLIYNMVMIPSGVEDKSFQLLCKEIEECRNENYKK